MYLLLFTFKNTNKVLKGLTGSGWSFAWQVPLETLETTETEILNKYACAENHGGACGNIILVTSRGCQFYYINSFSLEN